MKKFDFGLIRGKARQGRAWQGLAWQGTGYYVASNTFTEGVRRCESIKSTAWLGPAWRGRVWQGKGYYVASNTFTEGVRRCERHQKRGWARLGEARQGKAWRGLLRSVEHLHRGCSTMREASSNKEKNKMSSTLFFGKVSTDAEVSTLLTAFANAKADDVIKYSDVAALVSVEVDSNRFRTITRRWRGIMLKQYNLEIRPRQGVGFVVLAAKDRVSANIGDSLRLFKRVDKTQRNLRLIPRHELSDQDVTRLDHATLLVARVADLGKTASVQLALPDHKAMPVRPFPEGGL